MAFAVAHGFLSLDLSFHLSLKTNIFLFKKKFKKKKKEKGAVCVCFHEKAIVAPPHGHDGRPLVSFVLGFSSVFIGPTIQGQCIDVRLLFWDVDRFTGVSILNPHKAKR